MRSDGGNEVKKLGAFAAMLVLAACVQTEVGNRTQTRSVDGETSAQRDAYCHGQCAQFTADGKCIRFQEDAAEICNKYDADMVKRTPPNLGNNSIYVGRANSTVEVNQVNQD